MSAAGARMTADEQRSAHLLFAAEIARGDIAFEAVLASPEVREAVRTLAVPSAPLRGFQRMQVKRGRLTYLAGSVEPMMRARRAVLGDRAPGPPRLLIRVDEFPHYEAWDVASAYDTDAFDRFHSVLRDAGVPYLLAVTPRVARLPMDPTGHEWRAHDGPERAALHRVAADPGTAFGVHGLDHRARRTNPRKHSELLGLKPAELGALLDEADAVLARDGLPADVFVPPFNRFDAAQFKQLAARYEVVTGGPETVSRIGFHRTPLWRAGTVFLPAYAPLYGRAREILPAIDELDALQPGLWVPMVLHWGWEHDDGGRDLERLATRVAGLARPWSELLGDARAGAAAVAAREPGAPA